MEVSEIRISRKCLPRRNLIQMSKWTSTCFILLVLQRHVKCVWVKYVSFHNISWQWLRQETLQFLACFLPQKGIKWVCIIKMLCLCVCVCVCFGENCCFGYEGGENIFFDFSILMKSWLLWNVRTTLSDVMPQKTSVFLSFYMTEGFAFSDSALLQLKWQFQVCISANFCLPSRGSCPSNLMLEHSIEI